MTAVIVITVVSVGAVAFMIRFLAALYRDGHRDGCEIVQIVRTEKRLHTEPRPLKLGRVLAIAGPEHRTRVPGSQKRRIAPEIPLVKERRA